MENLEITPARKPKFFAKVIGAKGSSQIILTKKCKTLHGVMQRMVYCIVLVIFETAVNTTSVRKFFSEKMLHFVPKTCKA